MKDRFKDLAMKLQIIDSQRMGKARQLTEEEYIKLCDVWKELIRDILIEALKDSDWGELDAFTETFFKLYDKRKELLDVDTLEPFYDG